MSPGRQQVRVLTRAQARPCYPLCSTTRPSSRGAAAGDSERSARSMTATPGDCSASVRACCGRPGRRRGLPCGRVFVIAATPVRRASRSGPAAGLAVRDRPPRCANVRSVREFTDRPPLPVDGPTPTASSSAPCWPTSTTACPTTSGWCSSWPTANSSTDAEVAAAIGVPRARRPGPDRAARRSSRTACCPATGGPSPPRWPVCARASSGP